MLFPLLLLGGGAVGAYYLFRDEKKLKGDTGSTGSGPTSPKPAISTPNFDAWGDAEWRVNCNPLDPEGIAIKADVEKAWKGFQEGPPNFPPTVAGQATAFGEWARIMTEKTGKQQYSVSAACCVMRDLYGKKW